MRNPIKPVKPRPKTARKNGARKAPTSISFEAFCQLNRSLAINQSNASARFDLAMLHFGDVNAIKANNRGEYKVEFPDELLEPGICIVEDDVKLAALLVKLQTSPRKLNQHEKRLYANLRSGFEWLDLALQVETDQRSAKDRLAQQYLENILLQPETNIAQILAIILQDENAELSAQQRKQQAMFDRVYREGGQFSMFHHTAERQAGKLDTIAGWCVSPSQKVRPIK